MMFRDKAFAMECLKRISYFRLKAYWWDMQSDPINHVFTNGSCFEDVIERYEFDNALRKILFTAIDTIEIALRTKLIYHMSQAHGGLWYMDGSLFNNANLHAKQLQHLQVEFAESGEVEPIWATKRDQKTWLEKIIASMFGCLGRNA